MRTEANGENEGICLDQGQLPAQELPGFKPFSLILECNALGICEQTG
jgi:hypothetical protein